jgi:AraC-like DNA-binding protein
MPEVGSTVKSVATTAEHWRDLVSGTTVPIELEVAAGSTFHGSLRSFVAADIAVVRTSSMAQTATRTSRGCRKAPVEMVKVLVQHRGQAVIEQLGRSAVVGNRSLVVYDTSHPYTLKQTTDFEADAILVPRELLPITAAMIARVQQQPINLRRGVGAMFESHLNALHDQLDDCSVTTAARCVNLLVDMLSAALYEEPDHAVSATALRRLAIEWIDAHLSDSDIDPAHVAAAIGVSVRYLHQIFEGTGVGVAGYIRRERLQRIRMDLTDPRYAGQTIAMIGSKWGIPDQAHLSRLCRKEFDRTPGELRREAAPVGS